MPLTWLAFVLIHSAADWPQFLGPLRNSTSPASNLEPGALKGAKQVWKKDVGAGFSSVAVEGNKLILFHRVNNKETVECLNPATGDRLWVFDYPTSYRDDFGFDEGPRGTPAIAANRVFTFGAEGTLHALDLSTGKKLWRSDTHVQFKVRKGFFGAAASPLADAKTVFVNVGGPDNAGIVAFDAATGVVRWSATNDDAGYSSPVFATIGSIESLLCVTRSGLVAADPASGKVRFQFPFRSRSSASVNAALPIVSGDLIFLSASYATGAVLLKAGADNKLSTVWASDEALSNHYATSVLRDGYVYGFHGRQEQGPSLRCIELKTGKVQWDAPDIGAGTVTLTGDKLLVVKEDGEAILAPATAKAWQPSSRIRLIPGVVRSYPALAGGRLFVRNEKQLTAWTVPGL